MKKATFERQNDEQLIVIDCKMVCAYDFFAHNLLTDFDGVLGLDFFKGVKFCIDMNKSEITIQ